MTRINSVTQKKNFLNSFCARELSVTELRLFNVDEGRVRLRDRIADFFGKKNPEFDLTSKHKKLKELCHRFPLRSDQAENANKNLDNLYLLSIPKSSSGPVYEGL